MKTIEYSPQGEAIADSAAEDRAREFLKGDTDTINVSTDNFIYAVRALIHENFIAHTDVQFHFNDLFLHPDRNGRLTLWPSGFCDYNEKWLSRLLRESQ